MAQNALTALTVARGWELTPSAIPRGGQFRLLFVTSNARNAETSAISTYNGFVREKLFADEGHAGFGRVSGSTSFTNVVACTSAFDARDNARMTGTGVPIYWLNGNKVADNYANFHDGGWDDETNPRDESGNLVTTFVDRIWTGCNHNGTAKSGATLGHSGDRAAFGGLNHSSHGPLSNSGNAADTALQGRLYGITRIFTVGDARIASAAITSTPRNTTRGYVVGEVIRVRIRFNEPVEVTQANDPPSVWLKVGNEVRRAWYVSGSGTADLAFDYTVQGGDVDSNGVSLCSDTSLHGTCGSITKNGGTILASADDSGVPLNYPEMAEQAAHKIDQTRITGVSMQSTPASGDTYAAAETVTVRVTFSEAVDVTGTPYVYLNVGGAVRKAVFTSGSGSANLDFAYTVAAADFDADGVKVCTQTALNRGCGRVQLDGGAIVASSDELVASLALPAQEDQSGHKVVGTPMSGGSTMGDPAMGTVRPDWSLHPPGVALGEPFRLIFVTSANRNANPTNIDDYNRFVIGAAGGGHADIVAYKNGFRALASTSAVDAHDNTATTGTGVPIYWLSGNKVANDYADLYDNSWDDESNVRNEHGNPEADGYVWTGSDQYGASKISPLSNSAALGSSSGANTGLLGSAAEAGADAGPIDSRVVWPRSAQFPLYGLSQVLRTPARTTEDIRIVSTAANRRYELGDTIAVQATFSAPVAVRGAPGIDLKIGEKVAVARYVSGSGTDRLRFEYVVMLGDYDENGIGLSLERDSESPFRLDGAAIVDAVAGAGISVNLRQTTLTGGGANHRVEARPPAATGVSMASSPASGDTYEIGETITVGLTMRLDVTVLLPGRPHVWLEVGGAVRRAEYSGPVASTTRTLEFSYTVQEGDIDTDGVRLCSSDRPGIDCGRIHLNGGTIRAARGGVDAELGTPRQGAQAGHKVGVTEPIVTVPPSACSAEIAVRPNWALVPSGVGAGGKFRLLFITSNRVNPTSNQIEPYNSEVQERANVGHSAIRPYKSGVRVLGSSQAVNARTNTCTTGAGTGIAIHWLNGGKVADSYSDLYDGSWQNASGGKNEDGDVRLQTGVWSGTHDNGTTAYYFGYDGSDGDRVTYGNPYVGNPLNRGWSRKSTISPFPLYGLSQVFTVREARTTAWSILSTPAAANTYRRDELIEVAVNFNEPVAVLGEPVINLAFGDNPSNLTGQVGFYLRGSGTSRLVFGYRVASGIRDTTGFQFSDRPIELRGGTIRAVANNFAAALTIPAWSALTPSQNVDGGLDALTGGICERTSQVRGALLAKMQENGTAATDCSLVTGAHLAGITGTLELDNEGIEALKPGDFAGLSGLTTLNLTGNALTALPAGIFDGLGALINLYLINNNLPAGSLPDRVFEPLTGVDRIDLRGNPGFASFLPLADAGADLVLDAGETATLGGPAGGPWGTNAEFTWVEVDADGNEVADAARAEGLAAANVARPGFTAPALAEERVLRYRFTVQGRGWAYNRPAVGYRASDTVAVTVRAAPAVTAVALTSAPRADATYRAGERIEVSVTFAAPVTVTGKPRIRLRLDSGVVQVPYARKAGPAVLVFGYTVVADDMDADGVEVDADAILLSGGTIIGAHGAAAMLGHDAVAASTAHRVDGSTPALIGGVCERTPQVRDALVTKVQNRDATVTDCSDVDATHLAAVDTLAVEDPGLTALKAGDFAGLSGVLALYLANNTALSALPAGVFEGAESAHTIWLSNNALVEGSLPDRVFETLTRLQTLLLGENPGSASFVPRADAGEDLVLRTGETATLGGPGTGRDPWGTNVAYAWVEVDAQGNPVADADRAEGLSATDVEKPGFTAPALTEERVLRYRLTVTGKGATTTGTFNRHRASDTVTVTVRATPAVTAVALTSAPQSGGRYRRGERIEVSVTFSQPVTVSGPLAMTPTIGLEVGTQVRRAGYFTRAAPNVLVFGYTAVREDVDDNGIAVPENGILLEGATITGSRGTAALLGHGALAADTAHRVDGGQAGRTGGVCGRTEQVRDALVAKAKVRAPSVIDCSQVTGSRLAAMTGTLQLGNKEIAALKPGDFEGLGGLEVVVLSGNALGALPERVLEPLTRLTALDLSLNPGSASFLPRADAGADVIVSAGGTVTLGGPGTGRDAWGTNADYRWVEVDADGSQVAPAERTKGLSGERAREAGFTAPALAEERVLRYRLAVQGRGHNGTDAYRAADTMTVTVRAAPTVTGVALTSLPRDRTLGEYRRDERIEVSVTFSVPVTVTGVPRIGIEVGTETRRAFFVSKAGPAVLLFSYAVAVDEMDEDGVAVPANGLRLAGGTIVDGYDAPAFLDHDGVAADAAHKVDGSLDEVLLIGGVCERTAQVRDAVVAKAQANDPLVTNCSQVDDDDVIDELAGITGTLDLSNQGIAALKVGDFAGLAGVTNLLLNDNALTALPAGVFDGLGANVTLLFLNNNALGAGSIEDGVFEPLTGVSELQMNRNPGSASFVPRADAGADLVLRAGESATLGGPGTGGGPWGTNVTHAWVEVDAEGNPVAATERTEGLSAADVEKPRFTAPVLAPERVLRYRLTVTGKGAATVGNLDRHRASGTVTVTVRAAPAVTAVAVTSVPQNRISQTYRAGERIEVSVTFSQPVTVTGTPTIGLEVGTETRQAAFLTRTVPNVLVFGYTVTDTNTDDDGIAVPANGILLASGTIADAYGAPAFLGHDAVAADVAHQVDGSLPVLIGGVCNRTPEVRDALVAKARANDAAVTDCSQVGDDDGIDELAGIMGALQLHSRGIAALKPGDFEGLSGVTALYLNDNALSALPAGVFDGLGAVTILTLSHNALGAGSLEDGIFEPLTGLSTRLSTLDLAANPGSASFVPKADAGEDLVLRAGESATLGGPGTGGGPWGTNVTHAWVEVDADDSPVAAAERTEGLSVMDVARPGFTAPALAAERVLRYRLAVQGQGHGGTDAYTATDTVTVTVRTGSAVTDVALTSVPQNPTFRTYRAGERIEVSVTFSAPVTVTGTPTIGLEVGMETRQAAYLTRTASHVLVFGYTVTDADTDDDGIAVPENGILLAGGTIADMRGGAAGLDHAAVAEDATHKVDGSDMVRIGGVCGRTLQVRDVLVVHAIAKNAMVTHCSEVGVVVGLDELDGALDLSGQGIAALKHEDFAGLSGITGLDLSGNTLTALAGGGVRAADRSGDARPERQPRQRELPAHGGGGGGPGPARGRDRGAGRTGHWRGPVGGRTSTTSGSRSTRRAARWRRQSARRGLSATDVEKPRFTAPALAAERVLRYRFTVTGKGAATTGAVNRHRATDTVTVTVRAAPAVTTVALTSVPQGGRDLPGGRADRCERDLLGAGDGDRDTDDRDRDGDGDAPSCVCAQRRPRGAAVLLCGGIGGHGRRRHRGAGRRHPARRRDHRRRERRGNSRPRCGDGGCGAQGPTVRMWC